MSAYCPICKSDKIKIKCKGPHVGAYCQECGAFIKWLNKQEKRNLMYITNSENDDVQIIYHEPQEGAFINSVEE